MPSSPTDPDAEIRARIAALWTPRARAEARQHWEAFLERLARDLLDPRGLDRMLAADDGEGPDAC